MDIFGQGQYFSHHVLFTAKTNALIRYSACALAAKRMGQMAEPTSRVTPTKGNMLVKQTIERSQRDYLWYGAKYYERAIHLLANEISRHCSTDFPASLSEVYMLIGGSPASHSSVAPRTDTSPLVAACILIQYERLSATMRAWSGHVGGVVKLLKLNDATMCAQSSPGMDMLSETSTIQPLFWSVALNDLELSCKNTINSIGLRAPIVHAN